MPTFIKGVASALIVAPWSLNEIGQVLSNGAWVDIIRAGG